MVNKISYLITTINALIAILFFWWVINNFPFSLVHLNCSVYTKIIFDSLLFINFLFCHSYFIGINRRDYCCIVSVCILLMFIFWQPLPQIIYSIGYINPNLIFLVWLPVQIVLVRNLGFLEFLGYKDGNSSPFLQSDGIYSIVRHPMHFWQTLIIGFNSTLTLGKLTFWIIMVIYFVIVIPREEKHLYELFGEKYRRYKNQTYRLIPFIW